MENLVDYLLQNHIKPSYPRLKVLEYLIKNRNHPTVDQIYQELVQEMPTLSKTTVYNSLNTLIKVNLVQLITIEDNETRYDADISSHGHFKCGVCGKIYDFSIQLKTLETTGLDLFRITEKSVYFKGFCPGCLQSKNNLGG